MADDIPFDRTTLPQAGAMTRVSALVRRLVAGNGGPFTFTGTCTYIVGNDPVAIIDPGPADEGHITRLLDAVRGETVSHILITHTHRDHSPGAAAVKRATGAVLAGCGPHVASRELLEGEAPLLDASADRDYRPDFQMRDGDTIHVGGATLGAIDTPGHTMNHLCFALHEESTLFSGDHVMAWSTSVVAPPDGHMGAYMASLEKLRGRQELLFWPGHGGPMREPERFVRAMLGHRRSREASILARIKAGDRTIGAIVPQLYDGLAATLRGAAALSVYAHLEDMTARGLVTCEGVPTLNSVYRPVA